MNLNPRKRKIRGDGSDSSDIIKYSMDIGYLLHKYKQYIDSLRQMELDLELGRHVDRHSLKVKTRKIQERVMAGLEMA